MSFYQYDGPAGEFSQNHGFSQAVVLPASAKIVITAGQAGCDLKTGKVVTTSAEAQISAAFDCVEAALKKAGVEKGLLGVHKFLTFMLDTDLEPVMMKIWRERCPGHRPTWTCVGSSKLCFPEMIVEIQAEATLSSHVGRAEVYNWHCTPPILSDVRTNETASATNPSSPAEAVEQVDRITVPSALDEIRARFGSLGEGDSPRRIEVSPGGFGDISKETSILVDFVAQDFSLGAISDYQVTFNDNYTTVARLLANEFGRGFQTDVYHYRDAPFFKRAHGGIPRSMGLSELAVLDLYGSFTLPSPEVADSFIAAFFDRVHATLPILDRSAFLKGYSAAPKPSNVSLLLLHSVLLSGSTTFEHPNLKLPHGEVSWRLYGRAKALVENRFEQDRLVLVQSHLLFSTFVSDSCDDTLQNMWLCLGTAVRIAQGLGMHRALGKANASEPMRRQWKRIWWSLFVHDTLCSFEWGRPRAINLADCDVEYLTEADFQPEYPGSLPSAEHTRFFLELVNLCLIISSWLDLLRPCRYRDHQGGGRGNNLDRNSRALALLTELQQWHKGIPTTLQPPRSSAGGGGGGGGALGTGFTLWTATLHITYQAALLRFCTLLPEGTDTMFRAAADISHVCEDLDRQDLLGSLWNFGIHEFDLAMVLHARQANSSDPATSRTGVRNLQRGLPWARKLGSRSSVAQQAQMFYEDLVKKMNKRSRTGRRPVSATATTTIRHDDGVDGSDHGQRPSIPTPTGRATVAAAGEVGEPFEDATVQSLAGSNGAHTDWAPEMYFTDPLFQAQMMAHDDNAGWGWDMYYDQAQFQHQQQFR
ncbi:hypothetical protein AYO20_05599 [Fonsecaea nubica]|uniref:Xylanolytic transcriptional activator regulatory domain-containing protein n=1 Tax=Fonsecaea nubica TaxID=856822 RepID=A0A178D0V5_9EURO|nr:hypothetical protein AYO20_05599 [Fonsecaea nubica]OAL35122.1 hypothetical protein AYO20_05599 [Fonsecaea nubica]